MLRHPQGRASLETANLPPFVRVVPAAHEGWVAKTPTELQTVSSLRAAIWGASRTASFAPEINVLFY